MEIKEMYQRLINPSLDPTSDVGVNPSDCGTILENGTMQLNCTCTIYDPCRGMAPKVFYDELKKVVEEFAILGEVEDADQAIRLPAWGAKNILNPHTLYEKGVVFKRHAFYQPNVDSPHSIEGCMVGRNIVQRSGRNYVEEVYAINLLQSF